ncbi:geranylgeranyl reductase family protein [Roseovarius sp. SYSU LYC5161]|uniref:geranylgeranyl reductase family protein n=1 Tax=Roseovarius halophilus (ex Wu et al. 2025) TaxID=3376060 RepID=UPI003999A7C7
MKHADIVIIGAGPAGSAAAATACGLGLQTALIDARRFPRDKLCGGLITGRSRRHYRDIFGQDMPGALADRKTAPEFHLHGQPLGPINDVPPLDLTMRWDFDAATHAKAIAAGAVDMSGHRVTGLDRVARRLTLGDGRHLRYGVLIGADGVNSWTARQLFGAAFDRATIGFALEIEAAGAHLDPAAPIRIDIAAVAWGYGWRFPKSCATTVGVGGLMARNGDMKAAMHRYMAQLGIAEDAARLKGQFLPFGDFRKVPGQGAVLLAGDAAGLVDPITGEGIAHALHSGQLAARAAHAALAGGGPETALRRYQRLLRPLHRELRMARLLRPLFHVPALQRRLAPAFRQSTTLKRQYMDLLAGEAGYGDILRGLARRVPALALAHRAGRPGPP